MPTKLTDADLERLRSVAKAATWAPWTAEAWLQILHTMLQSAAERDSKLLPVLMQWPLPQCQADAAHIAAFDPPTAITLLDRIAALEAELIACRSQLDHAQGYREGFERQMVANIRAWHLRLNNNPAPPWQTNRVLDEMLALADRLEGE